MAARSISASREIEGRDSVGLYLDEIARTPLLDAAAEVELSKTIEAGLFAESLLTEGRVGRKKGGAPLTASEAELEWLAEEGRKATTQFINANLRLVVSIARKYGRAQMPMLDLIQEGNTGLIRAVEKFDYTKGYKFSTYATWWVRQAITRGIAQQARVVRLPVHVVEELNQVGGARRTLERQLGREPEPEEIATELGMELDRVLDLIAWGRDHVSLDTPVDEDGDTSLGDLMAQETSPGPDDTVLDVESRERLDALVGELDDRAADIIRARYGLLDGRQHKLADIGLRHGISAERVRQLEREALQKLRRLGDPDLAA
jgi:RNA polymerase primary sigma factor